MINFHFSVPIKIGEKADNPAGKKVLQISGDAITEGTTRNKIKYTKEELSSSAKSLEGKPILDTHRQDSINNILGRVTKSTFEGNKIGFSASIMDPKAIEMIEDGRIQNVSIGAKVDDLVKEEEGDVMLAKGIDFLELSLCSVPGDPNATIASALSESYKVDRMADTKVKEDNAPPAAGAPAPAQAQDPMAVLMEIKNMMTSMMDMMKGSGDEKAKAESAKAISALSEKLAQVEAQLAPKSKGLVGEAAATKEEVVTKGNREEHIQENGKKFVIEHTAGGKSSFWVE